MGAERRELPAPVNPPELSSIGARQPGGLLAAGVRERLRQRMQSAIARARRAGKPALASVSWPPAAKLDPVALVAGCRRHGESWFCLEQADRDGYAVAGLGSAVALEASGEHRFARVEEQWRMHAAAGLADPVAGPAGSGLIAVGGFAFAPDGGADPRWEGFPAASMVVPEVSVARGGDQCTVTVNAAVQPDDLVEDRLERLVNRLTSLGPTALPLLDPAPVGSYQVRSALPPAHYEQAVAAAVARIRAGEIEKIVLCREVEVQAPAPYDPAAILGVLRAAFPTCYVFAVGRGEAAFLGASPELLVRRQGQRATTVALAGSTARSADPAVDDHLGERLLRSAKDQEENAIVARRIATSLRRRALWVAAAPEASLIKVAGIQHLARPVRAQLATPVGAIELAGELHPTPAVGGEPGTRAAELIPALEGVDRGWYAGPIGWTDMAGDGEFCVALRCALVRGPRGRLYAGCGIVRDSDPAAELAETELKLGALLPLLAG